jgi:hypothetical protein
MSFEVGDKIKRPNGKMVYEVLKNDSKSRFGKYLILNVETGKTYTYNRTRIRDFEIWNPFKPKEIKRKELNFDFKNGV